MTSHNLLGYLRQLCSDIDEGRPLRRFDVRRALTSVAVPAAIGIASMTFSGCHPQPTDTTPDAVALYAAPPVVVVVQSEVCGNSVDDDGDGSVDCSDPDCDGACGVYAEYAVPFPQPVVEVCGNSVDDDGDGSVDCRDSDCDCAPPPVMRYLAPRPR